MIDSTLSLSLDNISLLSFDRLGNLQPLNSPNSFIWVGHASFHQLYTHLSSSYLPFSDLPFSYLHYKPSLSHRLTRHKQQKLAVRQLATLMINKIVLEDKRSDSHMSIYVDESNYPYLVKPLNYPISFSHSQNQVACVIQRHGKVGIDLELKSIPTSVFHRFFSADEITWLLSLPADDQAIVKRLLWMVKEAMLKGRGDSKSILMHQLKSSCITPTRTLFEEYKTYQSSTALKTNANKNQLISCRYIDQIEQNSLDDLCTDLLLYLPSLGLVTASRFYSLIQTKELRC